MIKFNIFQKTDNNLYLYLAEVLELNSRAACIKAFELVEKSSSLVSSRKEKEYYKVTDGQKILDLVAKPIL